VKGAWHVVEIYCGLSLWGVFVAARKSSGQYTTLTITTVATVVILLLAWRTYRGSRLASRMLSAYIMFNAAINIWTDVVKIRSVDVYSVYMLGIYVYLIVGAIMLWRIKELPTRFTDPPAEPTAHA
jgi:hypothetical protein